jgi:uncharacterized protein (TIGR00369 family)
MKEENIMKKLPRYPECFVCGRENIAGTDVTFISNEESVTCDYTALSKHQSYKGILHGGIISALLDECMGWAVAIHEKMMYVTGELNVKFIRSVPLGTKIRVKGLYDESQSPDSKYRLSYGRIEDKDGTVYATAQGKFHPIPSELEGPILSLLEIENDPEYKVTSRDIWG